MSEEFIGAGWAFPMAIDATGGIALVRRERELEDSMRLILATAYGERPMRPEFGCGIHDYVFAPSDDSTAGMIAYEVRQSIERWETRVDVVEVDVQPDPLDTSIMFIDIKYTVRGSNDPRNLVFPFYVIPEET